MNIFFTFPLIILSILNMPIVILILSDPKINPKKIHLNHKLIIISFSAGILIIFNDLFHIKFFLIFWILFILYLSIWGLKRLLIIGIYRLEEFLISISFFHLFISALWLLSTYTKTSFLGFNQPWKTLTAIHFQYAAFLGIFILGMTGRTIKQTHRKYWKISAWGTLLGIWSLALGIKFSINLELFSSVLLIICISSIIFFFPYSRSRFFFISSASIFFSMNFALIYTLGHSGLISLNLSIHEMIISHGILNSLGFSFFALLGFYKLKPHPLMFTSPPIFSKLITNSRVDSNIIEKMNWSTETEDSKYGLVDSMKDLENPLFSPSTLDDRISYFSENSGKLLNRKDKSFHSP